MNFDIKSLHDYHTYFHVDLLQSCRDYLSQQETNAETVWNNLITRVHPVKPFCAVAPGYHLSQNCRFCVTE